MTIYKSVYFFLASMYTMSLLVDNTYANPLNPLWAAAGSGGGGGGSTLQSPASVIPAVVGGAASFTVPNGAGGGDAEIDITDSTGNDAVLSMSNAAGGNSLIVMGPVGQRVLINAPSGGNSGQLTIGAAGSGTTYFGVDTVNNTVAVGNSSAVGGISLLCTTVIQDNASGGNGLGISPVSATQTVISQTIASGGLVSIGSSIAHTDTLNVTEVGGNGYVEVLGRGAANGVLLAGGVNQALVTTNTDSGGQMSIGCSRSGNYDAILITDVPQAQTIIKNQLPPAISNGNNVYFAGPFATGGNTIPAPVGLVAGVYLMMVNGVTASYFAQGATIAYWTGSVWGSGAAIVSANNGTGVLQIQPDPTTAGALFYNNSSGASLAATLILIPLFVGNIPSLA